MPSPPSTTLVLFLIALLCSALVVALFLSLYAGHKRRAHRAPQRSPSPPLEEIDGSGDGAVAAVMGGEEQRRRRKRGKKKRGGDGASVGEDEQQQQKRSPVLHEGHGAECKEHPFAFFSSASATQRKIKDKYDELVRSNQAKVLTVQQVGEFINCLVEARNELQHKSEIIQRSFKIKKALLFKADRSSFDRLCQQTSKLEAEHKRLEEDASVYNVLQEQLKLSPAYKTMLAIADRMEKKAEVDENTEGASISFEELLAQEKKDSFWQRYNKNRSAQN